jgi:flavin reductase (DIM6/NTAB) family NADH-FMN oxidoreductase RutF
MCRIKEKTFNISELRSTLGVFPTGVAVVTAAPEAQRPVGITINSFQSISLQPALVGWCIDGGAASFQAFARCSHFSISVLAASQAAIAKRFATRGADKFDGIPQGGPREPLIPGAAAWFRCLLYRQIPLGDHLMLVGQVEELGAASGDTLLFAGGHFGTAGSGGDVVRAA